MEQAPDKIISRRNRPAKSALTRDIIVAAALDVLAHDGLAGLSLRKVAAALDTGAASLYVYLANLDDLHALMLDSALAAVTLPETNASWRDRLKGFLLSYLRVLYQRPGLAQLALSTIAAGPNSLRIWEALLGLLKESGVDDGKAAWGVDLLVLYVTAIAAEQDLRRVSGQGLERAQTALATISADQFPLLFALKATLLSGGGPDRAEWALDVIIEGIVGGRLPPHGADAAGPRGSKA